MKLYLLSLAVGLLVGVLYNLLNVRSPAPPLIALIGLLGILAGEQAPTLLKQVLHRDTIAAARIAPQIEPHASGKPPAGGPTTDAHDDSATKS